MPYNKTAKHFAQATRRTSELIAPHCRLGTGVVLRDPERLYTTATVLLAARCTSDG